MFSQSTVTTEAGQSVNSSEHFYGATNRAIRSYCYVMLEIKIETCTLFFFKVTEP